MLFEGLQNAINKVFTSKKEQILPIMNREHQKLVHKNVLKFPEVVSKSIGAENNREIVLKYNYKK